MGCFGAPFCPDTENLWLSTVWTHHRSSLQWSFPVRGFHLSIDAEGHLGRSCSCRLGIRGKIGDSWITLKHRGDWLVCFVFFFEKMVVCWHCDMNRISILRHTISPRCPPISFRRMSVFSFEPWLFDLYRTLRRPRYESGRVFREVEVTQGSHSCGPLILFLKDSTCLYDSSVFVAFPKHII